MKPAPEGAPLNGEDDGADPLPKGEDAGTIPVPKAEAAGFGVDENGLGELEENGVELVAAPAAENGDAFVDPVEVAKGDAGGTFAVLALDIPNAGPAGLVASVLSSSGDKVLYFLASFANNSFS